MTSSVLLVRRRSESMIDWIFFAAWSAWLAWMGFAAIRWQALGLDAWAIGVALVLTHGLVLRRRITRLQDEILRRGLDDPDTRRERAAFEQRLKHAVESLRPVFYASLGILIVIVIGAAFLSNMSMPRSASVSGRRFPDGLMAIGFASSLYLFVFSHALWEIPRYLQHHFAWVWRHPTVDEPDERPTTLNLRDDEPADKMR